VSPVPADTLPCPPPGDDAGSGLNRALRRWLAALLRDVRPDLAASARQCDADRYRKHFGHFAHMVFLCYHGLSGHPSLRVSYATFPTAPGLVALAGLGTAHPERLGISFSQLADSSRSRPAALVSGLLPTLAARVRAAGVRPGAAIPAGVRVLDSTFLRLALGLVPWLPAQGGKDHPGVRAQVLYAPAFDLVEHLLVTDTRSNDVQGFDALLLDDPARLAALAGCTLVVDLGYYSHARFARLRAAEVHFVSRLHAQASLQVEEDCPVQSPLPGLDGGRIAVTADQRITLGSPNNRAGAVLPGLRLVTATVAPTPRARRNGAQPTTYRLVTDRGDLGAAEVVQLYLWRWEIELFFRWLKHHVHLPPWLGYSRNAVELTVALAMVIHLLLVLAARAIGLTRRTPALLARLRANLNHILALPACPAVQLPLPLWSTAPPPT
jgi:hypothetical protein